MAFRDIDVRTLYAFLVVAETEHFGRAAKRIGLSQPALSRQIQRLEQSLGIPLFQRRSDGVILSSLGHTFLPFVKRALNELESGERKLHQEHSMPVGTVCLGTVVSVGSFFIPRVFEQMKLLYPQLEVRTVEAQSHELEEQLAKRKIELAIHVGAAQTDALTSVRLWKEPYRLVASTEFLWPTPKGRETIASLKSELWAQTPSRHLSALLKKTIPDARFATHTDNLETIRRLVESGTAISVLPAIITDHLDWRVAIRDLRDADFTRGIYLTHLGLDELSPGARKLRETLLQLSESFAKRYS